MRIIYILAGDQNEALKHQALASVHLGAVRVHV